MQSTSSVAMLLSLAVSLGFVQVILRECGLLLLLMTRVECMRMIGESTLHGLYFVCERIALRMLIYFMVPVCLLNVKVTIIS